MDIDTSKTVYTKYSYAIPSAVSENDTITSALIDRRPKGYDLYADNGAKHSIYRWRCLLIFRQTHLL